MPINESPVASDIDLQIGSLLFEGLDQIDLTDPFEVFARIVNSTYGINGLADEPARDVKGLRLTPDALIDEAPELDQLYVPCGFGREDLMDNERLLVRLRRQGDGA